MSRAGEWIKRLRGRGPAFDREFEEEMRFHLETRAAELEAWGLSRREATLQARREFGSTALAGEESRAAWHFQWLADLAADLRHALRAFGRSPAFTLTAIASLALGIGATSAIFTTLDAVLLRPLPVHEPGQLVHFSITREGLHPETDLPASFAHQLASSTVFDSMVLSDADGLSFALDGRAERIIGEFVSPNYFTALGVRPFLGEGFSADVRAGHWAAEAVLSYRFWQRRFGGDPGIIGRTIRLNTVPFTIAGVSPPSFFGLVRATDYELRIPLLPEGQENAHIAGLSEPWIGAVARLKPGARVAQAEAAADAQFQEFLRKETAAAAARREKLRHVRLSSAARGYDEYVASFETPLYVLLVLVAIVLLIACSNVANMLLARATARSRELAVRASIGAGRFRLVRQMLAESLLLSAIGGAAGLAVAYWAAGALFRFLPQGHINLAIDLAPDTRALLFTFAVALVTGLLFGVLPALEATRGDVAASLKDDTAGSIGRRGARLRKAVLVIQVAFSMLLLLAAGVFVRTAAALRPTDFRGNPERLLLFTMKPQQENYPEERRRVIVSEVLRRVTALPGVHSAAFAENGPLGSRTDEDTVQAPGRDPIRVGGDSISPGFFETAGIPLVAGRDFTAADRHGSPLAVIVNEALARMLFAGQNPLGRRVRVPLGKSDGTYEIVGVAANTHYNDIHKSSQPFLWLCLDQISPYMPTLHVRTSNPDTAVMIAAVRHEFDLVDKGFPVFNIRTMQMRIEDALARERMVASLSGAFGMVALVLAAVGLYGILAYTVSRRTREIGIRMALGANVRSVLWIVAGEAFAIVAAGTGAGVLLGLASFRLLAHSVPGIATVDATVAALCTVLMLMIGVAASAMPAMRGCRIDPVRALRHG